MRNLAPALIYTRGFYAQFSWKVLKSMHFDLPSQKFYLFYAKKRQNCNYTRQWLGIMQNIWNQTNSNDLLIHRGQVSPVLLSRAFSASNYNLFTVLMFHLSWPQFQGSQNLQMKCFKLACNIVLISRRIKWEPM